MSEDQNISASDSTGVDIPEEQNDGDTPPYLMYSRLMRSRLDNASREIAELSRLLNRQEMEKLAAEVEARAYRVTQAEVERQSLRPPIDADQKATFRHLSKSLILSVFAAALILGSFYLFADPGLSPFLQDLTVAGIIIVVVLGVGFAAESLKTLAK